MRTIVAFIGRAGSGKDYQCSLLQEEGYKKLAFADVLREIACHTLGLECAYVMEHYEQLKVTPLYNGQTFRNILENLGSAIRKLDRDFFAREVIKKIIVDDTSNYCISDLRYLSEAMLLWNSFSCSTVKFRFCDYHSYRYQEKNLHESATLSNALCTMGYQDLQDLTIQDLIKAERSYSLQHLVDVSQNLGLYKLEE